MTDLTVIILAHNEALHIQRALFSLKSIAKRIVLVDSYSTDDTVRIATETGASVYSNRFVNYARQFEWALQETAIDTQWVMRMDADEYLTPSLAEEIRNRLHDLPSDVTGVVIKRRVHFMGKWIRHGGYY